MTTSDPTGTAITWTGGSCPVSWRRGQVRSRAHNGSRLCSNETVHVFAVVASVLPLALLSAVSPMVFINATTIQLRDGNRGTLHFLLGNVILVTLICVVGAGLLGATFTSFVEREVVSTGVDIVLALVLLAYGTYLLRQNYRPKAQSTQTSNNLVRGLVIMATNFTSIPLILAASQHLGASGWPVWAVIPSLVLCAGLTVAPAWLPMVLAAVMPGALTTVQQRQQRAAQGPSGPGLGAKISGLLPVLTCLLGAGFLIVHAFTHV